MQRVEEAAAKPHQGLWIKQADAYGKRSGAGQHSKHCRVVCDTVDDVRYFHAS
ncbi:hypothetical protein [Luteibacter sp.]|jgi:hypothetical protein|uniref:hypothetical protein n=1 Tax=Luteibacter sp. TaxID=1886636 RepID=UPI002F40B653